MKPSLLLLLSIVLSPTFTISAQSISQDSRGKDILEIYKAEHLAGTFTPGQLSLSLNYNFVLGSPFYFHEVGKPANISVNNSHAISVTAKVTGSGTTQGKPFNLSKELIRPAYRLEIGYQRTIDKFVDIDFVPNFTYVAGFNLFGEWQHINLYDTTTKQFTSKKPFVFGAHGHFTLFHRSGYFAISLSQDLSRTYNSDGFLPYQRLSGTYIDGNIASQQDFHGYIGRFDKASSFRTRLSVPVFINRYFNIIPYYAKSGYLHKPTTDLTGFSVNILNGSPRKKNGTIGKGFGFGMDWVKAKASWSSPNYFIFGTLDMSFLKKAAEAIALKKNYYFQ